MTDSLTFPDGSTIITDATDRPPVGYQELHVAGESDIPTGEHPSVDWKSMYYDLKASQPMRLRVLELPNTDPAEQPFVIVIDRIPRELKDAVEQWTGEIVDQTGARGVLLFRNEIQLGDNQ